MARLMEPHHPCNAAVCPRVELNPVGGLAISVGGHQYLPIIGLHVGKFTLKANLFIMTWRTVWPLAHG